MKRLVYLGMFILVSLVVLITSAELSYSISTYEIKNDGEYYLTSGTNVRTTGFFCKNLKHVDDGTSELFRDNSELIKIPTNTSNYLLIVKSNGNTSGNLRESECKLYEYNAPLFNVTCTANSIGSDESAYCDLYLTTSNYGNERVNFKKIGDNLTITDFDSTNFNYVESNNYFTFMPKDELKINYKYLVGTLKVTNISKPDGITNDLIFDEIEVKDSVSSFKIDSIKFSFMEGKIDYDKSASTTTTSAVQSPKTDIEYNSKNKNSSSKAKVRNIIILFLIVIISSIGLGFVIVFFFRDKRN
jgi:hypothetical protein